MPIATHGAVELYYETFGRREDPTLVLVNGLGSQCINYDVELCALFTERGFFVIRFDNRDVGLSTKFEAFTPKLSDVVNAVQSGHEPTVPYRLSDMADDVVAILDDLGMDVAHVVGMSLGGMIVQQLGIDHPERLRSMTSIMSTTGDRDVGYTSPEVAELFYAPPAHDREDVIANAQALERRYASPTEFSLERVARRVGAAYDRCFCPRGVARQLAATIASGSRTEALRSVHVPTLVIHGDEDRLIDISGGVRTTEVIPGATFVEVTGMGHDLPPAYWGRIVTLISDHAQTSEIST